jgi:hypothetical protein
MPKKSFPEQISAAENIEASHSPTQRHVQSCSFLEKLEQLTLPNVSLARTICLGGSAVEDFPLQCLVD